MACGFCRVGDMFENIELRSLVHNMCEYDRMCIQTCNYCGASIIVDKKVPLAGFKWDWEGNKRKEK